MTDPTRDKVYGRFRVWRLHVQDFMFDGETALGKSFDITVIVAILASVVAVMLESIPEIDASYGSFLYKTEWVLTVIFTVEYVVRLICADSPRRYAGSFYGIIDLLAVIPTYLSVIIPGAHTLLVIRLLRILRIFRVLKLVKYLTALDTLVDALTASWRKVAIFLTAIFVLVIILGSLIYLVEGPQNGYDSIPRSVYWAIVTLTTVGYGDIFPQTPAGQAIASIVMVIGYAIIAVPTGIVSSEIALARRGPSRTRKACLRCFETSHDMRARFCHSCGGPLEPERRPRRKFSSAGTRRL